MKTTVKKIWAVLLIATLCFNISLGVVAQGSFSSNLNSQGSIISTVENWVEENYGDYYYIKNIDVQFDRSFDTKNSTKFHLIVTFDKMLKFTSVEELPYVEGVRETLSSTSRSALISVQEKSFVENYIDSLNEYIGIYTDTTIDIVAEITMSSTKSTSAFDLYFKEINTATLYPIEVLGICSDQMKIDGSNSVDDIIAYERNNAMSSMSRGYANYDRIAARDYALTYTSNNPSTCSCGDTSAHSAKYDTSFWNSAYTVYSHTDCANYSSQAMAAGGIPTDATWKKDSLAWINSNSLKEYMTTTKGYWDSSTFAAANAGNILRWKNTAASSARHVVIITLNDTVTRQYSGHTTDRKSSVYTSNSDYEFFTIKTT